MGAFAADGIPVFRPMGQQVSGPSGPLTGLRHTRLPDVHYRFAEPAETGRTRLDPYLEIM